MKKGLCRIALPVAIIILLIFLSLGGCRKVTNPVKYQYGTFPDSVYILDGLNSAYDDFGINGGSGNTSTDPAHILITSIPVIFSSNRGSNGSQADLLSGSINFQFDQTNGKFEVNGVTTSDAFYTAIVNKANSSGNEYSPYTQFINSDGYEYLFYSSDQTGGQLDLFYERYLPRNGNNLPVISGPYAITRLNSASDDAYVTMNSRMDSVYFCSDRGGNYDIFVQPDTVLTPFSTWLGGSYQTSFLADSLNSSGNDKCPFIFRNIMVFASDRAGGLGGYDLYYSVFRNGKWNAPVNFGPGINTSSDEFSPVVGYTGEFTNRLLVFSSNRPGGKGGYDLYFTGYNFPN